MTDLELGCPFCELAANGGEAIVSQNTKALIIRPLNPVTDGHLLVIPRVHVTNAAVRPHVTAYVMYQAAIAADLAGDCNIITSIGEGATQTVQHLHVHVVPRRSGDGLKLPWTQNGDSDDAS